MYYVLDSDWDDTVHLHNIQIKTFNEDEVTIDKKGYLWENKQKIMGYCSVFKIKELAIKEHNRIINEEIDNLLESINVLKSELIKE